MAESTTALDDLLRLVRELGLDKPRPVVIVCDWMAGLNGFSRVKDKREEWRIGRDALHRIAASSIGTPDPVFVASVDTLLGVPVEEEREPPVELLAHFLTCEEPEVGLAPKWQEMRDKIQSASR